MTQYLSSIDGIQAEQLAGFFEGWPNPPSPEKHLRLLHGSAEVALALETETGMMVRNDHNLP